MVLGFRPLGLDRQSQVTTGALMCAACRLGDTTLSKTWVNCFFIRNEALRWATASTSSILKASGKCSMPLSFMRWREFDIHRLESFCSYQQMGYCERHQESNNWCSWVFVPSLTSYLCESILLSSARSIGIEFAWLTVLLNGSFSEE